MVIVSSPPGVVSIRKAGSTALKGAVTLTGGTNVTLTQSGQDISIASTGAGGASWDAITAAAGSATTANGDNAIIYNVAQTTANRISWRFSEGTAGVSTGTPVLLQVDTIAASTAVPFLVKTRATEVFRVSPTSTQIQAAQGTASAPIYSFFDDSDSGMYSASDIIGISVGAADLFRFSTNITAGYFAITDAGATYPNVNMNLNAMLGVSVSNAARPGLRLFTASANATAPRSTFAKSRGSIDAPTVITTGDDLGQISAYGFVGSTNDFLEAANITFDSTGVIADTTTGIGGIIRFSTRAVGGSLTERFGIQETGEVNFVSVAAPGTPADGDLWNDSTQETLIQFTSGIQQRLIGCVGTQTSTVTVANTVTETTLVGTLIGTVTLPANFWVIGKTIRLRASGVYSTTAVTPSTMNFRVRLGGIAGTIVLNSGVQTPTGSVTDELWNIDAIITCRTTGATGTVFSQAPIILSDSVTSAVIWEMKNTATVTIDTTASAAIVLSIEYGTAAAGDTISCTNLMVEVLN